MKFYKCHSQKYKNNKVLFIPEQFDEIGPDVFNNTTFEVIILSRKVKIISDHVFTNLKKCKVYIPENVTEIDPLAFEDIYEGNEFFCKAGTVAYQVLTENNQIINEDISYILNLAETLAKEDERNKPKPEPKKETTSENDFPTIEPETVAICPEPEVKEYPEEKYIPAQENNCKTDLSLNEKDREEEFIKLFGLPPVLSEISGMGAEWKSDISKMDNEEILFIYDDLEYTDEFRYLCYCELKSRFLNKKPEDEEILLKNKATEQKEPEEPEELYCADDETVALIGFPPRCEENEIDPDWYRILDVLSTAEVLERYDSDEYTDVYKLACYKVLSQRNDLETVINS